MQQNYFQNDVLRRENPFPQFNVASYKRPGIRLSFEYATTLLLGEGEEFFQKGVLRRGHQQSQ